MDESKAINNLTKSCIIISASGMADAGRIRHHIQNNIEFSSGNVVRAGATVNGFDATVWRRAWNPDREPPPSFRARAPSFRARGTGPGGGRAARRRA